MKKGDDLTITKYENGWKVELCPEWKRGKKAQKETETREWTKIFPVEKFDEVRQCVIDELHSIV